MSNNSAGPISPNPLLPWDEAWKSVRRLAEAHQSVADETADQSGPIDGSESAASGRDRNAEDVVFISEQVQSDFADIESASAALRKAQPDLEPWSPPPPEVARTTKPRSVWLVIGAVWISTVLLMAMATFAIASLLR